MSLSTSFHVPGTDRRTRRAGEAASPGWFGIRVPIRERPRWLRMVILLLGFALVVALGIAALRIDLIRVRYALAAAMKKEEALMNEQRMLIVKRRELRDPVELATRARARGFRPPTRVLSLSDPIIDGGSAPSIADALPHVAAGPPGREEDVDWQ